MKKMIQGFAGICVIGTLISTIWRFRKKGARYATVNTARYAEGGY